jgi:predicted tellurium resistance membrane protein TerC
MNKFLHSTLRDFLKRHPTIKMAIRSLISMILAAIAIELGLGDLVTEISQQIPVESVAP